MPVSKTNVKSRIDAAVASGNLPPDVQEYLEAVRREDETIGLTKQQKAAVVDAYLDKPAAEWDLASTREVVQLIQRNWADIPN